MLAYSDWIKPRSRASSDQLHRLEARVSVASDDDVVMHRDAERGRDLGDVLRHADVGGEGLGSPEGWLCARISAVAESSSARFTTSRG